MPEFVLDDEQMYSGGLEWEQLTSLADDLGVGYAHITDELSLRDKILGEGIPTK